MKLRHRSFEIPEGAVIRDENGRFFLHKKRSECVELAREEAREYMRHHKQVDSKKKNQFTYPSIGEQWVSHRQFFELGMAFVGIGRNELTRDWKNVFALTRLQSLTPISYNFLHGIELGLKAFLLHVDKRILPIDLRDCYRHNTRKLLMKAAEHGLVIERSIVIPDNLDVAQLDEGRDLGTSVDESWVEGIFGKACRRDEQKFDNAIGISFERYAEKGTEYPISVFENYEDAYLASVASLAYTLFARIRDTVGFFDQRQRREHSELESWLEELHSERRNFRLSDDEAAEQIGRLIDDDL